MSEQPRPSSLRILQITDATTWRGGERQLLYLAEGLVEQGHQVAVACPRHSVVAQRFQAEGIPVIPLALRGGPLRALPDFLRAVRRFRPHLLAAQTSGAHTLALLASGLYPLPPLVVHRRRPSQAARLRGWKYRHPRVRRYLAISRFIAQSLEAIGVPRSRIAVVPSALRFPLPPVPSPGTLGLRQYPWTVGTVAAFTGEKNLTFWLEVMALVLRQRPEGAGVLVGEGRLEPLLRQWAQRLGIADRIHILRYQPGIAGLFTVFLSTSRIEGLGTALMEALAYGVPVVAPQVGGIPEVVRPQQTGFLVDTWQAEAFAQRVLQLLQDPHLRHRMGTAARQDIRTRFSVGSMVQRTLEVYQEVLL